MSGEDDKQANFLDAIKRLMPHLKEVNIKDPDECETFLRRIDAELPEGHAKIFHSLVEAYWSGSPLAVLFQNALNMVLERSDLNEADKERALSDAEEFWALLNGFREGSHMPRGLVFQFAFLALVTGLQAGLSPEEVEKLRAGWPAEMGSKGGKKSPAGREANWPWKPHAKERAQEACKHDPGLSNGAIASKIECSWKAADVKCPSHRTLEGFASGLRKSGELPQRSGS